MKQRGSNLLVSVATIVIFLVVAELVMEWTSTPSGYYTWTPHFSFTSNVANGTMPGVSGTSEFNINSLGLRGNEMIDAETKIIAIGGSTTECFYLDNEDAWPLLLEKKLSSTTPCWVGNMGRSGLNTSHHILQMEKGVDQYGSLNHVIFFIGINDLIHDINEAQGIFLDPRSRMEQTFMQLPKRDSLGWFERRRLVMAVNRVFQTADTTLPEHMVQDEAGKSYNKWRYNRQNNAGWIDTLPNLNVFIARYRNRIDSLITMCEEKNIRPLFMTQPTLYDKELPPHLERLLWLGGIGKFQGNDPCPYYSTAVMKQLISLYNNTTIDACRKRDIPCLDVASRLAKDTTIFYDDCHLNTNGSERVASELHEYFKQHLK